MSPVGNLVYAPGADARGVPNPTTPLDDEFLEKLTPVYNADKALVEAKWCPGLHELEVFGRCGGVAFAEKSPIDFIAGRRSSSTAGITRLERVYMEFESYQEMDIPKELEEKGLAMDGFVLGTTYPSDSCSGSASSVRTHCAVLLSTGPRFCIKPHTPAMPHVT